MKIRDLSEVTALNSTYYFPVDNGTVNRKVAFSNLFTGVPGVVSVGHYYRQVSNYVRGTAPTSNLFGNLTFTDSNGARYAALQTEILTTGVNNIRLVLETPTEEGGGASGLLLSKDADGVLTCAVAGDTTVSGTLMAEITTDSIRNVAAKNSRVEVHLRASAGGASGVYNATLAKWMMYMTQADIPLVVVPALADATTTNTGNLYSSPAGVLYRSTSSSKRYKHNIKPLTDWKDVLNIPVMSFVYNKGYVSPDDQRYNKPVPGFIAEDVAEAYPIAADKVDGAVEDWNVRFIVPPMLAVEQDHEKRIAELEAEIARLKGEVA